MTLRELIDRVRRLAGSLGEYRRRVRAAVAGESARLIAEAVRDLLAAALGGSREPPEPAWAKARRHRDWDDEPDWRDDGFDPPEHAEKESPEARLPAATSAGFAVSRWWAGRGPAWLGAGLGTLTAAAAFFGGPLLQTAASLAAAAATLFA